MIKKPGRSIITFVCLLVVILIAGYMLWGYAAFFNAMGGHSQKAEAYYGQNRELVLNTVDEIFRLYDLGALKKQSDLSSHFYEETLNSVGKKYDVDKLKDFLKKMYDSDVVSGVRIHNENNVFIRYGGFRINDGLSILRKKQKLSYDIYEPISYEKVDKNVYYFTGDD